MNCENKKQKKIQSKNGITLIALIITIIILLILAGITISQLSENGLFGKARKSASMAEIASAKEHAQLYVTEVITGYYKDGSTGTLLSYIDNQIGTGASLGADYYLKKGTGTTSKITETEKIASMRVVYADSEITEINIEVYKGSSQAEAFASTKIVSGKIESDGKIIWDEVTTASGGNTETLPENTPEHPQDMGKEVALKDGWGEQTVVYTKTSDGTEVKGLTTVATVYAVSVGNGETVPVPKGFYYVGGDLSTGVIISDNINDKYKYNPETRKDNDLDVDKTTYAYTTSLVGNQFVWIPCTTDSTDTSKVLYQKTDWETENGKWDTTTSIAELIQIQKYGGFYVGRYEAGLADTVTESIGNDGIAWDSSIFNTAGTPQSKAGVIPWMCIDWTHSKANAESMYNNNYVSSGLITGTQWDVILNTMIAKNCPITRGETSGTMAISDMKNSQYWGNFKDISISYTGRKAIYNYPTLTKFGGLESSTTIADESDLLTTGASSITEKYHIFDMASNVCEWEDEVSFNSTNGDCCVARGNGFWNNSYGSDGGSSMRRCSCEKTKTYIDIGFRTVLYIK